MRPLGIVVEESLGEVGAWWRREQSTVLLLFGVQVAAFSYLYFVPILTNHTFPHTMLQPYPSYQTRTEGRWFADLVLWAQGGSGVQSFLMIVATLVQACNGLLLGDLVGEQRRGRRFLLAALLCLFPAFIDFYSYSAGHLNLVVGDTFALLAALALLRGPLFFSRLVLPTCGFVASLASYQPNLALVGLLVAAVALLRVTRTAPEEAGPRPAEVLRELGTLLLVAVGSVVIYWLTTLLVIRDANPVRTRVNTLLEAWQQVEGAYGHTARFFSSGMDGLSPLGHWTAIAILVLGMTLFLWDARRRALWLMPVVLAVMAGIPLALRATFIINAAAWVAGRILFPFGYCLLFFLARGLKDRLVGVAVGVAGAGLLWSFLIFDTQQVNYAAYKSQRDGWWIGRIADRVEPLSSPTPGVAVALVVVGHYPELPADQFVRRPAKDIGLNTPTFEFYRQVTIMNTFLGRIAFRPPTGSELTRAKASMTGRRPWPAPESVYLVDQTVVVLLETPTPETPMTWPEGRQGRLVPPGVDRRDGTVLPAQHPLQLLSWCGEIPLPAGWHSPRRSPRRIRTGSAGARPPGRRRVGVLRVPRSLGGTRVGALLTADREPWPRPRLAARCFEEPCSRLRLQPGVLRGRTTALFARRTNHRSDPDPSSLSALAPTSRSTRCPRRRSRPRRPRYC